MGTRSLTVFFEPGASGTDYQTGEAWSQPESEIVVMYRQLDGYIGGHGVELAEFLSKGKVINGISQGDGANFNGMSCLAAQVVAHFKTGVGGFYLYPAGTRDSGEEYIYEVRSLDAGELEIRVLRGYPCENEIFRGSPQELAVFNEPAWE